MIYLANLSGNILNFGNILISLKLLVIVKGTEPRIWILYLYLNLHRRKKLFLLKIYFANVNKSTGNCGFVYIYHKDINFREDLFSWMQIFRLSSGSQTNKKKEKNGSIFTKQKCQKMTNLAKKWQKWCFYEQFYKSKTSKGRWPNNTIVPLIKLHLFINSNVNDIDCQIEQCYKLISTMYQIYDSRTNNSKNNWPKISCEKPCKNCIKLQRTKA